MQNTNWKNYCQAFAWPTLLLWLFVILGFGIGCYVALNDYVSLYIVCAVHAVFIYLAFTPMHEASHGNLHGKYNSCKWVNGLVGWSSSLLFIAPFPLFRILHLRHHSHTNHPEKDPDLWAMGNNPVVVALRCSTIILHYYWHFFTHTGRHTLRLMRQKISYLFLLLSYFMMIAAVSYMTSLEYALFTWVLPAIIASGILAFTFDWLPHHPHNVQQRYKDTRIILFPGLNFLMLGQNYHLIHHLYPKIPFYSYQKYFRESQKELSENEVNVVKWRDEL